MTKHRSTLVGLIVLLPIGCARQPDFTPLGEGMKAIGICLVVYGVVQVLGELVRNEPSDPKHPRRQRRDSQDDDGRKGG